MIQTWQMQEAKNNFSQVVKDAIDFGPQVITQHGVRVVVVFSYSEYQKLAAPQEKLADFFRYSPLAKVNLDLSRDTSPIR